MTDENDPKEDWRQVSDPEEEIYQGSQIVLGLVGVVAILFLLGLLIAMAVPP